MCGLELLRRIRVVGLALGNFLRRVLFVFRELSNRFVDAKSLVGVRGEEWLIVRVRVHLVFLLNLRRNLHILAEDLLIRVKEMFKLRLGALRERLVLELALVVFQFLQRDFVRRVVLIGFVLLNATERCVLIELA